MHGRRTELMSSRQETCYVRRTGSFLQPYPVAYHILQRHHDGSAKCVHQVGEGHLEQVSCTAVATARSRWSLFEHHVTTAYCSLSILQLVASLNARSTQLGVGGQCNKLTKDGINFQKSHQHMSARPHGEASIGTQVSGL
jgi:hypothetical protein